MSYIRLKGTFLDESGEPIVGKVLRIQLVQQIVDQVYKVHNDNITRDVTLRLDGSFELMVRATDEDGVLPADGKNRYRIIQLWGAVNQYLIEVPKDSTDGELDIAQAPRTALSPSGNVTYVVGPRGPQGPAGEPGGGGGVSNLVELDDVDITDIGDGKTLQYDLGTETFQFVSFPPDLTNDLADEVATRSSIDSILVDDITALTNSLADEVGNRTSADNDINDSIADLYGRTFSIATADDYIARDPVTAGLVLFWNVTDGKWSPGNDNNIASANPWVSGDGYTLRDVLNDAKTRIDGKADQVGLSAVAANLDTEIADRETADTTEATARAAADTTLTSNLAAHIGNTSNPHNTRGSNLQANDPTNGSTPTILNTVLSNIYSGIASAISAAVATYLPLAGGTLTGILRHAGIQSSGGNARGTGATDLQITRALVTEVASGDYSTIGGGRRNKASGAYSTIAGGGSDTYPNIALGDLSFIGGGLGNEAQADYSTVAGGAFGLATSTGAFTGGGYNLQARNVYATAVGGYNSESTGQYSVVVGGYGLHATDSYSSILGGKNSRASGAYSSVLGGADHIASGMYSAAINQYGTSAAAWGSTFGYYNNIVSTADHSLAMGNYGSASYPGQFVQGITTFTGAQGEAQISVVGQTASTANATPAELFISGVNQGAVRLSLPTNKSIGYRLLLVARNQTSGNSSAWAGSGLIMRGAGDITLAGDSVTALTNPDGLTVAVTANITNQALKIMVTGLAANTVHWVARLDLVEVI